MLNMKMTDLTHLSSEMDADYVEQHFVQELYHIQRVQKRSCWLLLHELGVFRKVLKLYKAVETT